MRLCFTYCFRYLLFFAIIFIIPIILVLGIKLFNKSFIFNELFTLESCLYVGLLLLISGIFGIYHYFGEQYFHFKNISFNRTFIILVLINLLILIDYPITYFYYLNVPGLLKGQLISLLIATIASLIFSFFISKLNDQKRYYCMIGLFGFYGMLVVALIITVMDGLHFGIDKIDKIYFNSLLGALLLFIVIYLSLYFSEKKTTGSKTR